MATVMNKREVVSMKGKVSDTTNRKWKKKVDVCQEFGVLNSTIHMVWKRRRKIVSAFEQNGSSIKKF